MPIEIPRDQRELLAALLDAQVEFLLVGAHALGMHGIVRATHDMDVWVSEHPDNIARVKRALAMFGAPHHLIDLLPANDPGAILQLGVPPLRIDILTGISGVTFAGAWARRHTRLVEGLSLPVIGWEDLRANKLASGRDKDLRDVRLLDKARGAHSPGNQG
jgi:hypothetical protein